MATASVVGRPFNIADISGIDVRSFEGVTRLATLASMSERIDHLTSNTMSKSAISEQRDQDQDEQQWLITSPYTTKVHQLDLSTIDLQNQILAIALQILTPVSEDYAVLPYPETFQWESVMDVVRTLAKLSGVRWTRREFYVVEFRSRLKADIDRALLYKLDEMSHAEAAVSGGLLKYWYGKPDAERRNLATCLWRSKEDAIKGGQGPWHKQARGIIPRMYEQISVKGFQLVIDDDIAAFHFE